MTNSPSFVAPARAKLVQAQQPFVQDSLPAKLLLFVLGLIAGSVDVIGFLALNGLFTAHITGNIVVLATRFVAGEPTPLSHLLAIPAFMLVVGLTRFLSARMARAGRPSLLPLLLMELALLGGFFALGRAAGSHVNPDAASMVFAGMLGVSAMAVQSALLRIALTAPPTWLSGGSGRGARARERARYSFASIAGFVIGCAFAAASEPKFGLRALALPIACALVALALGIAASRRRGSLASPLPAARTF